MGCARSRLPRLARRLAHPHRPRAGHFAYSVSGFFCYDFITRNVIETGPTSRRDVPANGLPERDANVRRDLLNAVLESRTFAKSTKLAQFLKYICLQTIEGHAREINEQQIGVHVFARSPMYSASDDSIVRTQARLLRQKLEEYFEHEAPASALVITIPKGGYVPIFEPRRADLPVALTQPPLAGAGMASAPSPESGEKTKEEPTAEHRSGLLRTIAVLAAAALLAAVVVYLWVSNHQGRSASDALWTRIFGEGRPVVIVPSDDALVLFEEQTRQAVPLSEYLSGSYMDAADPARLGTDPLTSDWFTNHQYTSTADLQLTLRLGRLPEARNASVETRNARVLRIDDLKGHNVILIGGLGANPWVDLFMNRLDFEVNYDWKNSVGYVVNKHPAQGEAAIYRDDIVQGTRHNYGVFAFLPGIEDEGEALLFEGTGMAGTESASDFPFDPAAFTAFTRRIGATAHHIPYFEVLLKTTSVGGNAPEVDVVTWHPIQP